MAALASTPIESELLSSLPGIAPGSPDEISSIHGQIVAHKCPIAQCDLPTVTVQNSQEDRGLYLWIPARNRSAQIHHLVGKAGVTDCFRGRDGAPCRG